MQICKILSDPLCRLTVLEVRKSFAKDRRDPDYVRFLPPQKAAKDRDGRVPYSFWLRLRTTERTHCFQKILRYMWQ